MQHFLLHFGALYRPIFKGLSLVLHQKFIISSYCCTIAVQKFPTDFLHYYVSV